MEAPQVSFKPYNPNLNTNTNTQTDLTNVNTDSSPQFKPHPFSKIDFRGLMERCKTNEPEIFPEPKEIITASSTDKSANNLSALMEVIPEYGTHHKNQSDYDNMRMQKEQAMRVRHQHNLNLLREKQERELQTLIQRHLKSQDNMRNKHQSQFNAVLQEQEIERNSLTANSFYQNAISNNSVMIRLNQYTSSGNPLNQNHPLYQQQTKPAFIDQRTNGFQPVYQDKISTPMYQNHPVYQQQPNQMPLIDQRTNGFQPVNQNEISTPKRQYNNIAPNNTNEVVQNKRQKVDTRQNVGPKLEILTASRMSIICGLDLENFKNYVTGNVIYVDESGNNVLHYAADLNNESLFAYILEIYPSIATQFNQSGLTALDFAKTSKLEELISNGKQKT